MGKSLKPKIKCFFSQLVLGPQGFSLVLTLSFFAFLFVLLRMKGIEQDYQYNSIAKLTEKSRFERKSLRATNAKLLSINSLQKIAQKYNLKTPKQDHIIVIK